MWSGDPGTHGSGDHSLCSTAVIWTVTCITMRFSWVLRLAWVLVLLLGTHCYEAMPIPFLTPMEGSGWEDLESIFTSSEPSPDPTLMTQSYITQGPTHQAPPHNTHSPAHSTQSNADKTPPPATHSPAHTTQGHANMDLPNNCSPAPPSDSSGVEHFLLERMTGFLQDNLALVLALSALVAAAIFLACCAAAVSRHRKVAAYYPSAFPAGRYVDQRDKAGGAPSFREVPERPPDTRPAEQHDSGRQLQQDILNAAKKLRTPTKTASAGSKGGEGGKRTPPAVAPKTRLVSPERGESKAEGGAGGCAEQEFRREVRPLNMGLLYQLLWLPRIITLKPL
ncbi:hypothetical protein AGOR_G00250350 [Albula goreensis]|uniref:Transmembrane protein 119 n=1 Tax=Albula goreensis TaxID=1534307 RepID=A0A8T3CI79_9TELE|nr:hypothetical protein AGOR_G00250350 [Albula goreensis]